MEAKAASVFAGEKGGPFSWSLNAAGTIQLQSHIPMLNCIVGDFEIAIRGGWHVVIRP